jgi:hypothetical protein
MKTKFSNRELAHEWAHGSINFIGNGSNMFAEGNTIYSYGHHFPICRWVDTPVGRVFLMTSRSYSQTTSKHCSYVHRALYGEIITVGDLREPVQVNYFINSIRESLQKSVMARKNKPYYLQDAEAFRLAGLKYCEVLKIKALKHECAILENPILSEEALQVVREEVSKIEAEKVRLEKSKVRKAKKLELIDLGKWMNGEKSSIYLRYSDRDYLRVSGDIIQTSRGAVVSLGSCRLFWNLLKKGEAVHGFTFDERYQVTGMNGTLRVGCHNIERSELERVAALLGW